MPELKNARFLRTLLREPVDRTPIWIMRQAGRYLPEYRATRAKAGSFMNLCTYPELACEVTLQPLARFDLDAAILFSDILTIPDAMGLGLSFAQGEGPQFARPVRSAADVEKLGVPDPEGDLRYVMDAVRVIRRELDGRVPLIGFSGSPWTLATYMVEGSGSKEYAHVKGMLFDRPDLLHKLLDTTARAVTSYLNAQIAAGAQAVMVFDTWGGVLRHRDYIDFSLRYMAQIVDGLTREHEGRRVPEIMFTKGGGAWLESMTETGCDALGVDWTTDIGAARKRVGGRVALQGNMDPCVLYASPDRIRAEVATILKSYGAAPGHVFNLGHGIHQHVNPEHVKVMVDSVHELSAPYHRCSQARHCGVRSTRIPGASRDRTFRTLAEHGSLQRGHVQPHHRLSGAPASSMEIRADIYPAYRRTAAALPGVQCARPRSRQVRPDGRAFHSVARRDAHARGLRAPGRGPAGNM